ncbi:MAG: hypothetical protein CBC49_005130 [Alphaproteobacteria bacterium TMED89]|nr:MAG: hypothetical protein CBC49_005130 [Alphaproteobacteria bacterium TMED89]
MTTSGGVGRSIHQTKGGLSTCLSFGRSGQELTFVIFALLAALFSAFNTFQHVSFTSFLPDTSSMLGMTLGCAALFLSTVSWAVLIRCLGAGTRMAIAFGYLIAHGVFASATYLPVLLTQAYLVVFGLVGLGFLVLNLIRNLTPTVGLWCLSGLLMIPVLWSSVAFITFALTHANFVTSFVADRLMGPVMTDLLHQRAYIQIIHNHGVPSVGINGLGYHQYHWLVAYPLSTLSDFSGIEITRIHANILPGFTAPVLIHGLGVGLILMSSRLWLALAVSLKVLMVYVLAVLLSPVIVYGLVFVTPSTAYSLALAGPMIGLFVWYFSGNLSQLRSWHFLVFGGFIIAIGLSKVNTVLQVSILMGVLWCAFVLRLKNWILGVVFATLCLATTAAACLYFLVEIYSHGLVRAAAPEAFKSAFQALPELQQRAILEDVKQSLMPRAASAKQSEFERNVFYESAFGLSAIGLTILSVSLSLGVRGLRKHWHYMVLGGLVLLTLALVVQRTIFGYTTPTQVLYIIFPGLLLGLAFVSVVVTRPMVRIIGSKIPHARWGGRALAAGALVFAGLTLSIVHFKTTPEVRAMAVMTVSSDIGQLTTRQGKEILGSLTAPRVSTLGFGAPQPTGPAALAQYWESWDQRPLYQRAQSLQNFAQEHGDKKIAVFIPRSNPFWKQRPNAEETNSMFWVQGSTGLVLYRGKIERNADFKSGIVGRGISDFGGESAALISNSESVFCWSRFDGFTIIDFDLNVITEC